MLVLYSYRDEISQHKHVGWFEIEMHDPLSMAVAQRPDHLRRKNGRFVHRRPSSSGLHLVDPLDKTASGAALHYQEAH